MRHMHEDIESITRVMPGEPLARTDQFRTVDEEGRLCWRAFPAACFGKPCPDRLFVRRVIISPRARINDWPGIPDELPE